MTKRKVIIFDGPDACGKTNMAKELAVETGIPYFKNSDEHKYFLSDPDYFINAVRYVDTYFTSYLEATGASVILDRAWPSEWIYSKVMGRDTDLHVLRELDTRHAKLGTKLIIPWRSDYSKIRDDYKVINDNIQVIHNLYMEFAKYWTQCDVLLLNVDDENLERELTEIRQFVSK
jgi:thymidylate kinase